MKEIKFNKLSKFRCLFYSLLFLSCLIPLNNLLIPVYADVPSILNVEHSIDGTDIILNITVRHSGPTSNHYINSVQVEIDGVINTINLNQQTTEIFTVQYNMGELNSELSIRVRAHCIIHGYSSWSTSETIPEFGMINPIIIVIVLSILLLFLTFKIKTKNLKNR